jgi:DNA-binding MarR family transcriptional regulator
MTSAHDLDFGILVGLAYLTFVEELMDRMRTAGFDDLGPSHGYVFRALADAPLTLSDLARGLHMTTQGAAKIIEDMEAGGYVERTENPTDRRSRTIELAPRGRKALTAAPRNHRTYERRHADRLGDAAVAATRDVLGAIADSSHLDGSTRLMRPV